MSKVPKKVLFLGIDSPVASAIFKWAKEGKLPALRKLIDGGVFCEHGLVPFPTITPPNWTSIATGAWPGTHGVTDFDVHVPGTALDETHQGFDSGDIDAETLWEAGERVGKKSIVVNWPTSWPKRMKEGYQIAGYGLSITDWRNSVPIEELTSTMLVHDVLLSTEYYPRYSEVVWKKADGWEGVEHGPQALEAEVTVNLWRPKYPLQPITWYVMADKSNGTAYDTVVIARRKSKDAVYARLKVGEWSQNVFDSFATEQGDKQAVMRFKLLELSPDAQQFRVYCPGIFALDGWAFPAGLEQEIKSENGLPTARTAYEPFLMEWIDGQTLVEAYDLHHQWLVDATKTLFQKPWDMYFLHIHTIDWIYHTFSVELEPLLAQDKSLIAHYQDIELKLHQGVDWCIGQIVEAAGDDTLVVVMSDHGVKARGQKFEVADVFEKAGLLVYKPANEGEARQIDWSRTKAVSQRTVHIYVNTKGRDPQGIVEPGEEYEQVREQVIKALYEYADPKTGAHPIALALKNEDARIMGIWGPRAGDVIYAEDPRFGKEHGPYLTTNRYGYGDLRGLIIFNGPGIKQGEVIERNVWLTDIVPTVCHVAELPVPDKCDGSVVYQALEDPDGRTKELQSLRRNVDRLKRMVERPPMC